MSYKVGDRVTVIISNGKTISGYINKIESVGGNNHAITIDNGMPIEGGMNEFTIISSAEIKSIKVER